MSESKIKLRMIYNIEQVKMTLRKADGQKSPQRCRGYQRSGGSATSSWSATERRRALSRIAATLLRYCIPTQCLQPPELFGSPLCRITRCITREFRSRRRGRQLRRLHRGQLPRDIIAGSVGEEWQRGERLPRTTTPKVRCCRSPKHSSAVISQLLKNNKKYYFYRGAGVPFGRGAGSGEKSEASRVWPPRLSRSR